MPFKNKKNIPPTLKKTRSVGIMLHPTSLPGSTGIGTFGKYAYEFIDFLHEAGIEYWQMCPLGPTGYGDSPYQSFSAFAGNPYLIDLEELVELKLITFESLESLKNLPKNKVDYSSLYTEHEKVLREAFSNVKEGALYKKFKHFSKKEKEWLVPYATFRAIKKQHEQKPWIEWQPPYNCYKEVNNSKLMDSFINEIEYHQFLQFLFFTHHEKLHKYAKSKGISLIGDIPIFVAFDSADVWEKPELFTLDEAGKPSEVAGVPPDYFTEDGQLWGNPLYNWKEHEKTHYDWWLKRIQLNLKLFDLVRLDHFRGFSSYYAVAGDAQNARKGVWKKGPGAKFLKAITQHIPANKLIAEDLGIIDKEVVKLRKDFELPGMAVFQFAFDGNSENDFLPHNIERSQVAYAGTHDNDTSVGWYQSLNEAHKHQLRRYLDISGKEIAWDMIRLLYRCIANLSIITMQDLLSKGSEARMNFPGKSEGNWAWRMTEEEFHDIKNNATFYLQELKWLYGR